MKRILLSLLALAYVSIGFAQEGEPSKAPLATDNFKASFNIGTTAGEEIARNQYGVNLGFEFSYYYRVSKHFIVGPSVGATHIFKKGNRRDNSDLKTETKFAHLGGGFRLYTDNNKFFIGGDAGYAYGLDDGGFYYKPKIGVSINKHSGIILTYTDVDDTFDYTYVSIGYEFSF